MQTSMKSTGDAEGNAAMSMRMRIEAQRVGECSEKQG
jgi:hypothetical protein